MLKPILKQREDLQHLLFCRGFLITTRTLKETNQYPFFSKWKLFEVGEFNFYIHQLQHFQRIERKGTTFFMVGHAYNPFTMAHQEVDILEKLAKAFFEGEQAYADALDELTGVFLTGFVCCGSIRLVSDCSGMQYTAYGTVKNDFFAASHIQLFSDVCNLEMNPYVTKLINYRWYKYMLGNYLPGELSPFDGIKRLIPNTWVDYSKGRTKLKRFYPQKPLQMCSSPEEYNHLIEQAGELMQANMTLILEKWKNPAISLTGGVDSNTTFAAANGHYQKYKAFSYVAMPRELVDAGAAKQICDRFEVKHTTYQIPDNNQQVKDFETYKAILDHNAGKIGTTKDNDTRKKIILMQGNVCDVEVKSWISETIRAYAYKYFGRKKMPKNLRPRHYTSLYKIFFLNRWLACKTDKHFEDYIRNTKVKQHLFNYDETDLFVWEMMHGGKCGLNIGTMKFCFDITIPYNNRKLLDLLLRIPLEHRISDKHHMDLKKHLNKELFDMKIRVVNLNETKSRKQLANLYFTVHSLLPF